MTDSIAAVVVLYHPSKDVLTCISSYSEQVDIIWAIDNSTETNQELLSLLRQNKKIRYIGNSANLGVASALNTAINLAIGQKYGYLLMMDQDTSLEKSAVSVLWRALKDCPQSSLSSAADVRYTPANRTSQNTVSGLTAITSGSLLRLSHIPHLGLHEEKLFIDYVDFEYSLRANLLGYKVLNVPTAKMMHKLGNFQRINFFGFHTYITNHSPIRKYYRLRNSLYVWKKYFFHFPKWVIVDILRSCKDILKCFIFEPDRFSQLKAYICAVRDFAKAKYGKIDSI